MDNVAIITTSISAISTVICAIVAGLFAKSSKRQAENDARVEEREKQRAKEAKLQLKMINANSRLTVGVAMALKHGHCNGEVEEGLKAVTEADEAYRVFLEEIALEQIRKGGN